MCKKLIVCYDKELMLISVKVLEYVSLSSNVLSLVQKQCLLHKAAEEGNTEMVQTLLNHGANPNVQDIVIYMYYGLLLLHISMRGLHYSLL